MSEAADKMLQKSKGKFTDVMVIGYDDNGVMHVCCTNGTLAYCRLTLAEATRHVENHAKLEA